MYFLSFTGKAKFERQRLQLNRKNDEKSSDENMVLVPPESYATVEKIKESRTLILNVFDILAQTPFEDEE